MLRSHITSLKLLLCWFFLLAIFFACKESISASLVPITVAQFAKFVDATDYVTDAERYGWSIVQLNVYDFETVDAATWRLPDGITPPEGEQLPVTQVSYNDAKAYCQWAGTRLPTYEEYWELAEQDERTVVYNNHHPISPVDAFNIVGNVWEITEPASTKDPIRLAGGSLFCSESTCLGTQKDRVLHVDRATGNIHIGFAVVVER